MAKERCVKKSFQDSLEDIKERMKEKRTKKLAKVATVHKALATKVNIISNSSVTVKNFQANNKALALALDAEKCKTRQAQDLILHLKGEHQRLMFEIFILRRKLNMQGENNSSETKLAVLKDIIAKVTNNLLETANLLGPAHALCSSDGSLTSTPASTEAKRTAPPSFAKPLVPTCEPASDAPRHFSHVFENRSSTGRSCRQEQSSEKIATRTRLSKGRTSSSRQPKSDEKPDVEAESDNSFFRNVSIRRRASSLNVCTEESLKLLGEDQNLNSMWDFSEAEIIVPAEECFNKSSHDEVMDPDPKESPAKEEFIPFTSNSQISSSTPEPKPKPSLKGKTESRPVREKVRRGRADGQTSAQLKKPWENSKPKARSKSRERGASKPVVSKDKMNDSLNSGDAYDFVFEESVHVTPFKQTKLCSDLEGNEETAVERFINSSSITSDEELDDSLYVPTKAKEQNTSSLPLRPRSKRNKDLLQQYTEKAENKSNESAKPGKRNTRSGVKASVETDPKPAASEEINKGSKENVPLPKCIKQEENANLSTDVNTVQGNPVRSKARTKYESEGTSAAQRISLYDVTNLSSSSGSTESKKHPFPFSNDDNRKISGSCMRKRRCTVTVNYAEPNLSQKLRRGDPFTDTEFLLSPIFKNDNSKRKSINRKSLAKYNEAFVGCR
ncbi:shugoshin 1 [Rhinoderma darwinii]|uniref:shugoshin 1 n=1 Tax=Rhinoderma darwinii TaxID=43563 RepID=UPI003F67AEA8